MHELGQICISLVFSIFTAIRKVTEWKILPLLIHVDTKRLWDCFLDASLFSCQYCSWRSFIKLNCDDLSMINPLHHLSSDTTSWTQLYGWVLAYSVFHISDVIASPWQSNPETNQKLRQVTYTLALPPNSFGPKVSHVTETQVWHLYWVWFYLIILQVIVELETKYNSENAYEL